MESTQNIHNELSPIALFKSINKLALSEAQAERLLNLLLKNPRVRVISSHDISREAGLPLNVSAKILLTLSEKNIKFGSSILFTLQYDNNLIS